ncbi:MAG: transporter substrate-binding domain-containing protein [Gammaproteobacteria bacterium]|nr:transporter substrate-binding domain-containing protein [Gammaproteobacteria bacterium]
MLKIKSFLLLAILICLQVCLCSLVLAKETVQAKEKFIINTGFTAPVSTYFKKVLKEAGKRMNLDIELIEVSAERSLRLVSEGKADAECCRIHKVIKPFYPSLIDVPLSFYEMNWVAFSKDRTIKISSWEDLSQYRAGAVTGYKLAVIKVKKHSPNPNILDTHESMFNMLNRNRIDVAVSAKLSAMKVLKDMNLKDQIMLHEPAIFKIPLTLQLAPKHRHKKQLFEQVLNKMNVDGTNGQFFKEVIREL